jgi:hypothetical protein
MTFGCNYHSHSWTTSISYQQIYMFATTIFESQYSELTDQNIPLNAMAGPNRNNSLQ